MKSIISWGEEIKVFLLLLLTLISFTFNFYAQEGFECATPDPTGPLPVLNYPNNVDATYFNSLGTVVFNVYFWGINKDDGSSTNKLNQTDALHAIAQLNKKYNQFNVFFKYYGYGHINSTQYHTIKRCTEQGPPPYTTNCLYGSFSF